MLGPRQRTTLEAPNFTIGTRKEMKMNKFGKYIVILTVYRINMKQFVELCMYL